MTLYAGDAEPPRLTCWRLTTTRVRGGRLSFSHASTSYPGRASYQGGCIRWHAFLDHVWLFVFSQEASPIQAVLLSLYIHIYPNIVEIESQLHIPLQARPPRILIICNGKWPAVNPSAPRFQRPVLTSQQVKLVGCIPEASVAADFMRGLMYYLVQHKLPGSKPRRIVQRSARLFPKDRDPRPNAALDPKPLDQERKKQKIFLKLIAKASHLGRQLGGGVCRGQ